MRYNTTEIMNIGMACLVERLGVVEAEHFISVILRERFDYTKWQREYFNNVNPEAFLAAACAYDKAHPIAVRKKADQVEGSSV